MHHDFDAYDLNETKEQFTYTPTLLHPEHSLAFLIISINAFYYSL